MADEHDHDERRRILSLWWLLELFSPQRLPALTKRASQQKGREVIAWQAGEPLPWESRKGARSGKRSSKSRWRHTVYLGVYRLETAYEILESAFGKDPDAHDGRADGESACAGIVLDQDGRLVDGSAVLSSAAWGIGQLTRKRGGATGSAGDFADASKRFVDDVDRFEAARRDVSSDDAAVPYDEHSLLELCDLARRVAGVDGLDGFASEQLVIKSLQVSGGPAAPTADNDFLNSFHLDELAEVLDAVDRGDVGPALSAYLTGDAALPTEERVDVVACPDAVDDGVSARRIPRGRWPSNPRHALSRSQQFAVNRAVHELGPDGGMLGINGPPGTGKTTMLRDILAANVVERARRLAELATPDAAFTDVTHEWKDAKRYKRTVRQLRSELTGFEMVVASANNNAVENVTIEIPGEDAIHETWRGSVDHFGALATKLLAPGGDDGAAEDAVAPQAWGLIAARLGRKQHRTSFRSAFWFDAHPMDGQEPDDAGVGMQTLLQRWQDGAEPVTPWKDARAAFRRAERRVDTLLAQRRDAERRLHDLPVLEQEVQQLSERCEALRTQAEHASLAADARRSRLRLASDARAQATARLEQHLAAKPGLLEVLFSWGRAAKDWRASLEPLQADLDRVQHACRRLETEAEELTTRAARTRLELDMVMRERATTGQRLTATRDACRRDEARLASALPDPEATPEEREMRAPWLDRELDAARSELFFAALRLHRDFLANAAEDMSHGLRAACDVVAGLHPQDLPREKVRAAWQLFFLVVPMVSTTFASFARMFRGLGAEDLGWLFIDEAGQACPQYAAGAIWHARRVVAVGDPLQLEPVVTIAERPQLGIARSLDLDETWLAPRASVQTLADRVTPFGTLLAHGDDEVWVGAPLRVHRRCDEPMFSLCNHIAYGNLMVHGVHRRLDDPYDPDFFDSSSGPLVARSYWADEPSTQHGSHVQPNQIARAERALDYLERNDIPASDVIVVSPFRDMANQLRQLESKGHPGLRAGTIHTAQGREASVVILVLGGDPDKPGAPALWARTPNLVNVAASRAKRRLYVIGDRSLWARHPYFRDLARALS